MHSREPDSPNTGIIGPKSGRDSVFTKNFDVSQHLVISIVQQMLKTMHRLNVKFSERGNQEFNVPRPSLSSLRFHKFSHASTGFFTRFFYESSTWYTESIVETRLRLSLRYECFFAYQHPGKIMLSYNPRNTR